MLTSHTGCPAADVAFPACLCGWTMPGLYGALVSRRNRTLPIVAEAFEDMPPGGIRRLARAAAFGVAAIVGFLVAEAIIVVGLWVIYGSVSVPGSASSSPVLLALDVSALVIGVVVSFLLNERVTIRGHVSHTGRDRRGVLLRLGKFQAVSAFGNVVIVIVQLALLSTLGISPAIGSIIGGIVAYPVSYLASMKLVWNLRKDASRFHP